MTDDDPVRPRGDASVAGLASRLAELPPEEQEAASIEAERVGREAAAFAIAQRVRLHEERLWEAGRAARLAAGPRGETPEALAQSVVNLLCDDPDVWLTHGIPNEAKLEIIQRRVAAAIRFALENARHG